MNMVESVHEGVHTLQQNTTYIYIFFYIITEQEQEHIYGLKIFQPTVK